MSLRDFELASRRLEGIIHKTELDFSSTFSEMSGGEVYLKCENRQKTGSFKIRGAANKIAALSERGEAAAVVASSAGNHAQGVAYAAHQHGMKATIVMPKATPIAKVQATEGYGAKVVLFGDCYDDAYGRAMEICEAENATFIHPFDDYEVMAGQGTVGLEILSELPTVDTVVVPVGGGGLISGISACIKQVNPRVKVIGVQAQGADAAFRSFHEGKYVATERVSTIADGIAVKCPGKKTIETICKYVDDMVTVSDMEISAAILLLMERTKQIVEPAGAASLSAVLSGKIDAKDKRTVCLLSGGNIDVSFIHRVIEQGLVSRHRRLKFYTRLPDSPGSLGCLLHVIAEAGANIITILHDRLCSTLTPSEILVHIACEVGGEEHGKALVAALEESGYTVTLE
ncbi:MAG: threonine ammonia-lyase [Clostridia bacterium]|nr:threonine ammonia-lyase [Clostridia bacterium]